MTDHAHHYVIPPPEGPTVTGVCRHCQQTRTFDSAGPEDRHIYRRGYKNRTRPSLLEQYGFHEEG